MDAVTVGDTAEEEKYVERPRSILLAGLWSLLRAAFNILPFMVLLQQLRYFSLTQPEMGGPIYFPEWLRLIMGNVWSRDGILSLFEIDVVTSLLLIVLFLYASIGIVLGHKRSRTLFLGASIFAIANYLLLLGIHSVGHVLLSVAGLSFALWYFRRPELLAWFGVTEVRRPWLDAKVGRVPVTLGLAVGLVGFVLIAEVINLLHYLQYLSSV